MSDPDVVKTNAALETFESIHPEYTLAKYLVGATTLNYKDETHRIAIGRSLVLRMHLINSQNPSFENSSEYNQAVAYLKDKYGTYKAVQATEWYKNKWVK